MNKGLTQVAFGVLGAAMLSGSVFAAGPTVLPIPDVVITDRDKFGEFDSPTQATSANIYRFTSALSISDYVNYTPVDSSDTVSFLYTEHDFDENATGGAGAIRAGNRSLLIGGVEGETAAPNAGDIAGGPSVFQDILTTNIAYDIVNETRSGGDGTNPSGPNPGGPFLDEAVVQIYVAASAPSTQGAVATRTFNVYTTNDTDLLGLTFPGDQLLFTTATTIFTPVRRIDEFGGWIRVPSAEEFYQGGFDVGAQPINTATARWNTSQPPVTQPSTVAVQGELESNISYQVAPAATASLTVGTLASPGSSTATATRPYAPQFPFWRMSTRNLPTLSPSPIQIEQGAQGDDNIYMVRWNVSATDVPFAQRFNTPDVRFQVGEVSTFGVGAWKDEVVGGGVNSIRGANQQHRQYFIAETTGEVRMLFGAFGLFQAALLNPASTRPVNYNITVDSIDVFRFSRSELAAQSSNSSPVYNQGGGSAVTLAPGQPAPPSGGSNFSTVDWQFDLDKLLFGANDSFGGQNRWTTQNAGTRLSMTASSATYSQLAQASTLGFVFSQLPSDGLLTNEENEVISGVGNNQLVVMEAWLSSTNAATPNNNLPTVRLGLLADSFGGTSVVPGSVDADGIARPAGRASFREFEASNASAVDDSVPIPNFANLETASKRYTTVIEPQIRVTRTAEGAGQDPTMNFRLLVTPFALSFQGVTTQQTGNITVDHIAVYVYDLPEDVADVQVP